MASKVEKLESLLEAVPDALVGMDTSGVIRFVNHQSELMFGHGRADLVGEHVEILVSHALWNVYLSHRDDYFADPRTRAMGLDLELKARHQDGSEFPVMVCMSGIDNGDVLLEFTSVSDATRRAQAFDRAQRMMAIVENCDDAIIGKTLGGTITSWNPAAERMYGHSGLDVIGRSIDLLAPRDRSGEIAAILDRIRSGKSVDHFETIRLRKDGTPIWVSLSVSPIRDEDFQVVGACTIARDMTATRQATEMARAMLESSKDSLVSIGADGMITDANAATVTATGVCREMLIGTAFSDYFADPEKAKEVHHRVISAGGDLMDYPMSIRHRDGTLTDVTTSARIHRGTGGEVITVFAASRDQTRLTQALTEAKETGARLRAVVDSLLDPHMLLEAVRDDAGQIVDFVILDANTAACEYNGLTPAELTGSRLFDLFPGLLTTDLLRFFVEVVDAGGHLMLDDFVYHDHDVLGGDHRYDIRGARIGDGMSLTFRDVTDRYAAALTLAASEGQYRLLAENGSDVITSLDLDRRFEWVSGSVGEVLGWQSPDLVGHLIDEFVHPEDLSLIRPEGVDPVPGSVTSVELRFRCPDGSYRWVAVRTRVQVEEDGTVLAMVGGLVDIADRKHAEAREQARLAELERFHRLTIGRELQMIKLKEEIEYLKRANPQSLVPNAD